MHTVTTAPQSLADDSDHRLRQYLWTMGIRTHESMSTAAKKQLVRIP
ncbi:MAG TPA: DUF3099 domain-containing protein, partial [Dermatophilaceae bacterium]|nr:DUF3099 domain-containing protein [Dermatophilaceae bacterium]